MEQQTDKIRSLIVQIEDLKQEQKYTNAIKIIQDAIKKYNFDYRLYEELADVYLYKGELKKALKAVDFALELHPESATWNYLKGFILLSNDKILDALNFLEKSNKLWANNPEVLRNLWWAYVALWHTQRGISVLKRALVIAPEDELITEDLAMALIGIGKISEGNTLLKKIGKTDFI